MKSIARARVTFAMLSFTPWIPAQENPDPEALYHRAVLVEESERNLEEAARLFQLLGQNAAAPDELRAEAWLRAAQNLGRLGREDEAHAAFEAAAAGAGEAAVRAQETLQGDNQDRGSRIRLSERMLGAIKNLRMQTNWDLNDYPEWWPLVEQFRWIGESAVPYLVEAIEGEALDLDFVARATQVVIDLGGEDAAAFLHRVSGSPDLVYRRAVLRGFRSPGAEREPVRSALLAFLEDRDAQVRLEALNNLLAIAGSDVVLGMSEDPDPAIRRAVQSRCRTSFDRSQGWLAHYEKDLSILDRVADTVARGLQDPDSEVRRRAQSVTRYSQLLASPRGREVYLRALARSDLETGPDDGDWPLETVMRYQKGFLVESTLRFDPPLDARAVAGVARALGPLPEVDDPLACVSSGSVRQRALEQLIGRSLAGWKADQIRELLPLVELGYGRVLAKWMASSVDAGTWPALVAAYGRWDLPQVLVSRLESDAGTLTPEALAAVAEPLRAWLPIRLERAGGEHHGYQFAGLDPVARQVVRILGAHQACGSVGYLVADFPSMCVPVSESLMMREDAEASSGLIALLEAPSGKWLDRSDNYDLYREYTPYTGDGLSTASVARDRVFRRLVELGEAGAVGQLGSAYRLGLASSTRESFGYQAKGLQWLFHVDAGRADKPVRSAYDLQTRLAVLEDCLREGGVYAWEDLWPLVQLRIEEEQRSLRGNRGSWTEWFVTPDALLERIVPFVVQAPQGYRGRLLHHYLDERLPGFQELTRQGLRHADPAVKAILAQMSGPYDESLVPELIRLLDDPDVSVVGDAVRRLQRCDHPEVLEALQGMLGHDSASVRKRALDALAELSPPRAASAVQRLLDDPDAEVRTRAAELAGDLLVEAAVPRLLEALRDSSDEVRYHANASLEKIEFYRSRIQRWGRWSEGADLGTDSVVDALLEQAAAGNDPRIRLAAIQSLGTLGVPETLPLLIRFMTDEDAAVREAAAAAVERINRRAAASEKTGDEPPEEAGG